MYCGCAAKIEAFVDASPIDNNQIQVTYHWIHEGHTPTSIADMRTGPAQRAIANFIQEQADNNMTWYNIKNMLRLDKRVLIDILNEDNIEIILYGLNIKYNNVYYAMKKSLEKRLDSTPV